MTDVTIKENMSGETVSCHKLLSSLWPVLTKDDVLWDLTAFRIVFTTFYCVSICHYDTFWHIYHN